MPDVETSGKGYLSIGKGSRRPDREARGTPPAQMRPDIGRVQHRRLLTARAQDQARTGASRGRGARGEVFRPYQFTRETRVTRETGLDIFRVDCLTRVYQSTRDARVLFRGLATRRAMRSHLDILRRCIETLEGARRPLRQKEDRAAAGFFIPTLNASHYPIIRAAKNPAGRLFIESCCPHLPYTYC